MSSANDGDVCRTYFEICQIRHCDLLHQKFFVNRQKLYALTSMNLIYELSDYTTRRGDVRRTCVKTAYEMLRSLVGSQMCIRDSRKPVKAASAGFTRWALRRNAAATTSPRR